MSKLELVSRPWAMFDVANKQHRKWVADFQRTGTWANCPVRFIIEDSFTDLVSMVQQRMTEFYTAKEFGKVKA